MKRVFIHILCITFLFQLQHSIWADQSWNHGKDTHYSKSKSTEFRHIHFYRVKKNDTLYSISKRFKIPLATLCTINSISKNDRIKAGTVLSIAPKNIKSNSPSEKNDSTEFSTIIKSSTTPKFIWPVPHIVEYKKESMRGVKSIGITITSPPGSSVLSSASGVVRKVGHMRGYGNYVVITHTNRFATVYANLGRVFVSEGDNCTSGKIIGTMDVGCNNLHFQIDHQGKPMNPLNYLPKRT